MRHFFDKIVDIYHLVQVGNKSFYGDTLIASVMGYLKPLDEQQSAINGIEQFGYGFKLVVESGSDIEVTDKLIIEGKNYFVKGRKTISKGAISFDSFLLILSEN